MSDASPDDLGDLLEQPEPGFRQVMSCVFGIHEHETRTYLLLLDQPGSTVEELANQLERDRSNVNRSLSTLLDRGLVERERRLLDSGGYVYQYTGVELPEAKEMLHGALDEWTEHVHGVIETFDGDA
ncbi:helix-turn-helix domain-containing protein [Haloarchaeobius iranensis]|uniref:Predicted transcriptional regulator n=1 Tax=Haloarchaeobius iranensis TaxID=996166 RepID=A0A1G9VKH0_9EURY|nr:helix-turn-helix domain-containing protein [Haloarchaeobius iranensis]SDM72590.1 Predicted transcriptional regulator [Haloarchaeobius iranensis]